MGHLISNTFRDDDDMMKEVRNLYARGNTIVKIFRNTNEDVKVRMFKSFCYPVYCSSMWSHYNISTMNRVRVGYNNIFCKLFNIQRWDEESGIVASVTRLCEEKGIRSFTELFKYNAVNCHNRIVLSENRLIQGLIHSDAYICSRQWSHWEKLFTE